MVLLITGNLLFWTGNTLVKTDRFTASVAPIIKNSAVQTAVADYTTTQLYNNVDVSQVITQALPPRAEFLASSITGQLKSYTNSSATKSPEVTQIFRLNGIIQLTKAQFKIYLNCKKLRSRR